MRCLANPFTDSFGSVPTSFLCSQTLFSPSPFVVCHVFCFCWSDYSFILIDFCINLNVLRHFSVRAAAAIITVCTLAPFFLVRHLIYSCPVLPALAGIRGDSSVDASASAPGFQSSGFCLFETMLGVCQVSCTCRACAGARTCWLNFLLRWLICNLKWLLLLGQQMRVYSCMICWIVARLISRLLVLFSSAASRLAQMEFRPCKVVCAVLLRRVLSL